MQLYLFFTDTEKELAFFKQSEPEEVINQEVIADELEDGSNSLQEKNNTEEEQSTPETTFEEIVIEEQEGKLLSIEELNQDQYKEIVSMISGITFGQILEMTGKTQEDFVAAGYYYFEIKEMGESILLGFSSTDYNAICTSYGVLAGMIFSESQVSVASLKTTFGKEIKEKEKAGGYLYEVEINQITYTFFAESKNDENVKYCFFYY